MESLTPEVCQQLVDKLGKQHIMLSYNWSVQELVCAVFEYIESRGIPVWMDIKGGVSGNINAAMAKGVENAAVICPFMTEAYEKSESCELELNYAKDCKVQIVPCMTQERHSDGSQYRASGWLGVITAGKLWIDFKSHNDDKIITARAVQLLIEIANKLEIDTRPGFKPVSKPQPPKPEPPKPQPPKPQTPPSIPKSATPPTQHGVMNLALHKATYQSTVAHGGESKRAVDGNTDGVYSKKGVTHTDSTKDNGLAWWHVELGGWYKILNVKVWNRIECSERLNFAGVFAGKKMLGYVKFVKGQQCYEFGGDNYCTKSISIGLSTGQPLSLAQVEVWGTGEKGVELHDVALNKSCFQSTIGYGGDPNRAVNGNENNRYSSNNTTHTDPDKDKKNAWWYVELGSSYRISEINIVNRLECGERIDKAQIFIDQDHVHTIKYHKGLHYYHIPCNGKSGSRVGVTLTTGVALSMTEVQVLSDGMVSAPVPHVAPQPLVFNIKSKKAALQGYHSGFFVSAQSDGKVQCNRKDLKEWETFVVVQIVHQSVIALKSCHGKYLSAQPNGSLEWNRDKADIWEQFTVIVISDNKIALKSYHGKYVSAQPKGQIVANRDACANWEHFTVHWR